MKVFLDASHVQITSVEHSHYALDDAFRAQGVGRHIALDRSGRGQRVGAQSDGRYRAAVRRLDER
ncbi:hypothetical protein AYM40_09575 [Paraburkholderia phytofirmans OLGA172]|jgi:hypothetical protein|uniref:Uncharacterized protein n=1 Tax=Paraburkholderia phytofirmans OLGA172 TaxID=1417228 RepID=A0A160FKK8_9BURK|nr:hypothetical protein AYM40_09575 [Paraburkholderia phytofirmans OLGA172]